MERKGYFILLVIFLLLAVSALSIGGYVIKNNPGADGREWIEISIFGRCQEEPWGTDVDSFFSSKGILIYNKRISFIENCISCTGCDCPAPRKLEILVVKSDKMAVAEILANYIANKEFLTNYYLNQSNCAVNGSK